MKKLKDINDDEIRIIGSNPKPSVTNRISLTIGVTTTILIAALIGYFLLTETTKEDTLSKALVEPESSDLLKHAPKEKAYTLITDTVINSLSLTLFYPVHATPHLHIGELDKTDRSIVLAARAADIRADNGEIVGAFILKGNQKSRGVSKKGFCAIIGDSITLGTAQSTSRFEETTEKEGYFFRQYALVDHGKIVENKPKGRAIRRALCQVGNKIVVVQSNTAVTFHEFSQVLVDLKVDHAIYLVGSHVFSWAYDINGNRYESGIEHRLPENANYIYWKSK